jgi:hypothetical protein
VGRVTALITCGLCGTRNRINLGPHKSRCGKCKHEFAPRELATAKVERPKVDFELEREEDGPPEKMLYCIDDEDCGWDGVESDIEDRDVNNRPLCPECGGRVKEAR